MQVRTSSKNDLEMCQVLAFSVIQYFTPHPEM